MGRHLVRWLTVLSIVGIGIVGAFNGSPARAAGSGAKVTVYQKLTNFRLQDNIGVQGSGFPANTAVTVDLTTSINGSASDLGTHSVTTNSRGNFDTGAVQSVSCPQSGQISYQASAGGATSAAAASAC